MYSEKIKNKKHLQQLNVQAIMVGKSNKEEMK